MCLHPAQRRTWRGQYEWRNPTRKTVAYICIKRARNRGTGPFRSLALKRLKGTKKEETKKSTGAKTTTIVLRSDNYLFLTGSRQITANLIIASWQYPAKWVDIGRYRMLGNSVFSVDWVRSPLLLVPEVGQPSDSCCRGSSFRPQYIGHSGDGDLFPKP